MAKGKLVMGIEMSEFFTQTRLINCITVNCANRKNQEFLCNLKEIEIKEGQCLSFAEEQRGDVVVIPRKD